MTTQEILTKCTVEGMLIRLPDVQLDRKQYGEVKNALELIGGKWKGGKTQGFVFEQDPTELLQAQANGEQRNLKKEFQFFATPEALAIEMVRNLTHRVMIGDTILEPSAGDGALIKAFWNEHGWGVPVDCFEAMELNRIKLKNIGANIIGEDFLQCNDRMDYYDYIIANPPFTKNQDILHIAKMYQCLKPGGSIVTLASPSWTFGSLSMQKDFRYWLQQLNASTKDIDEGVFKGSGTMVRTVMITIEKPKSSIVEIPRSILEKLSNTPKERIYSGFTDVTELAEEAKASGFAENHPIGPKVRTCRECGCTESDCKQCIKKTGKPCHWVEDDLCRACYLPPPAEILDSIEQSMAESQQIFKELKSMLSPKNNDMNFFEQLATTGNIDLTLRIMQKGNTLTLNVMPGSGQSHTQPMIISGTPAELDAEFFPMLFPKITEIAGIVHNLNEVKNQAEEKQQAAKKPAPAPKKEDKTEKTVKKPEVKKPVAEKVDLFAASEVDENEEEAPDQDVAETDSETQTEDHDEPEEDTTDDDA